MSTSTDVQGQPGPRPLALVTGASSGIGRELARQFVEHGFDLMIAAEDHDIHSAASKLRHTGAVARAGFEAMMACEERVVSASVKTKLQAAASRVLPDSAKAQMHRKMAAPGSTKPS